ncbi:MAG: hypothetical protein ACP5JV_02165 [Thermus sp.]|uniref:COG1470 family protein n=1 Tax=Thermus sp. TaxID=275 RepID=UPI003D0A570C
MRKGIPKALLLALLSPALAQADLALSPARLELFLPPGGSAEERVVLKNGLPREEALQARLLPFALDARGGVVEAKDPGLCPHLEVLPTALVLPPGGSAEVRVRAQAPEGKGTLACLVVFSAAPRALERGGLRLSVRPQVGLAVYLTLKGTEAPALRARVGGEGKALPLLLENPGNVLQRVFGEARVFDGEGKEAARLPLEEVPVLPGGYRELALEPDPPLPKGRYRVVLLLESAYGRYAAEGVWDVP